MEQGHVRVGPDTITDPAFLVTRNMEDFVTWVDTSKIKRHVQKYNVSTAVLLSLWRLDTLPLTVTRAWFGTYRTSWTTSISWPSTSLFSPPSFALSKLLSTSPLYHLIVPYRNASAHHRSEARLEAYIRQKGRDSGDDMATTDATGTARPTPIRATDSP